MSYFKKLYDIGEEKVNSFRKKHGNPLREFEDALENLRADLTELMQQTAEFQAVKIRSEKDMLEYKTRIAEFERKAEQILAAGRESANPEAIEKAAAHALGMKRMYAEKSTSLTAQITGIDDKINFLKNSIEDMQERIAHYEKEYAFLKANYEKAEASKPTDTDAPITPDDRFEAMKLKMDSMESEYSKLDRLADDLYLADKHLRDAEIQTELEALKQKITPKRS